MSGIVKINHDRYMSQPTVRAPRIQVSEGNCCFCKEDFEDGYLFTRKQIYVCPTCAIIVDVIMETNLKGGLIDNISTVDNK